MSTTAVETTAGQRVPAGTWRVDPIHSTAVFEVEHLGFSVFRGGFEQFDAVLLSESDGSAVLEGAAEVASLTIDEEALRNHLLSPDFFDAARHPKVGFRADGLSADGDVVTVAGELEIGGHRHTVEARGQLRGPITDLVGGTRVGLGLETVVNRNDYELGGPMELPDGGKVIGDEVKLLVSLELVKD